MIAPLPGKSNGISDDDNNDSWEDGNNYGINDSSNDGSSKPSHDGNSNDGHGNGVGFGLARTLSLALVVQILRNFNGEEICPARCNCCIALCAVLRFREQLGPEFLPPQLLLDTPLVLPVIWSRRKETRDMRRASSRRASVLVEERRKP